MQTGPLGSKKPAAVADRPQMPSEYAISSSTDPSEMISWDRLSKQMEKSRNYWVATVSPNGLPHVMPVWGLWIDETFYFATGGETRKARNLEANPNLVVHLESGDEVVIIEGRVRRVTDAVELDQCEDAYDKKYSVRPGLGRSDNATFALEPVKAFAWLEKDFPSTATRWRWK